VHKRALTIERAIIMTALPLECHEVRRRLRDVHPEQDLQGHLYEVGELVSEHGCWKVLLVMSGQGNRAAARQTEHAIVYFKPVLALLIGVAGGLRDVRLGDVLVATLVYDYESGKDDIQFQARPRTYFASQTLVDLAGLVARRDEWQQQLAAPPTSRPLVHLKPLAAGEKVITSKRSPTYERLRTHYNDAVATAMEDAGFMEAALQHGVPALAIRGISDLIENKSESDAQGFQELAVSHACAFACALLDQWLLARTSADRQTISPAASAPLILPPIAQVLAEIPSYIETFQRARAVLAGEQPLYRDQCEKTRLVVERLAVALREAQAAPGSDCVQELRLTNAVNAVTSLQDSLEQLCQHCPPEDSRAAQRHYQQLLQRVRDSMDEVCQRLRYFKQ
jgi:nucleoside phosphorylase